MNLPDDLTDLIEAQDGIAHRRQLLEAGVTSSCLRWQLGRRWQLLLPGVVATFTGTPTARQRLVAGQLLAGPEGVITGPTAAVWHGIGAAAADGRIHLQVPRHLAARRHGFVVVTRTARPEPAPWLRGPLRLASPARAVMDAARLSGTPGDCRALILEAVQRRLVRVRDLRHELEAGPVRGSAVARRALAEAEAGSWSVPEADLAVVLRASTVLPPLIANPVLVSSSGERLPTPDLWIDEIGMAVQVHSRRHHAGAQEWDLTVMADGRLTEQGVIVIGVTPSRLARDPRGVRERVERTYLTFRGRPRPDVRLEWTPWP